MEYKLLQESCRGNGEDNCILCGYDPANNEKKLHIVTCDKCGKVRTQGTTSVAVKILLIVSLYSYMIFVLIKCMSL